MSLPADVLARYPAPLHGPATPLLNHGGFSGARLFRIDTPGGALCLRAWPANVDAAQLDFVHALMRRAVDANLEFVPRVLRTVGGESCVRVDGQWWELTTWMPGAADFHQQPTPQRLRVSCIALAQVHDAWSDPPPALATLPAVERRLAVVHDWQPLIASHWQPPADPLDPVAPWARRAWPIVRRRLREVERLLVPWRGRAMLLQPCLCDIWHDHVLFTSDRVTGLVDFGSCKIDHVAVDLARLLGSLAGDDGALWEVGLDAYAALRPLSAEERGLARDLDQTGVVVGAANWLRWLYRERRAYADRGAVARRLAALGQRMFAG
jgi:Ser/Thr protein kinase RdoA (MazF antagonist)